MSLSANIALRGVRENGRLLSESVRYAICVCLKCVSLTLDARGSAGRDAPNKPA